MNTAQLTQSRPRFINDVSPPYEAQLPPASEPKPAPQQTPQPTQSSDFKAEIVDNLEVKLPAGEAQKVQPSPQTIMETETVAQPQPLMDKILAEVNKAVHAQNDQLEQQSQPSQNKTEIIPKPIIQTVMAIAVCVLLIAAVLFLFKPQ